MPLTYTAILSEDFSTCPVNTISKKQCGGLLAASKSIRPVCCDDKYYHYICPKQGKIKYYISQTDASHKMIYTQ